MNRENLVAQVKAEYARLADQESLQHIWQATDEISPDAYYENILGMVLHEIDSGTFDSFDSGVEIVDVVARDKSRWLSQWDENALLH